MRPPSPPLASPQLRSDAAVAATNLTEAALRELLWWWWLMDGEQPPTIDVLLEPTWPGCAGRQSQPFGAAMAALYLPAAAALLLPARLCGCDSFGSTRPPVTPMDVIGGGLLLLLGAAAMARHVLAIVATVVVVALAAVARDT